MALIIKDRVMESSTTTGTGAMTLAGAYTGFRSFSSVCSTNDTCYYMIEAVDANGVPTGDWENGLGTYSAANTLTRTTVLDSSNSGSAVSFSSGTKRVAISIVASEVAGTVTTTGTPASGNLAKFSGSTSITNGDLSGDITTSGTLATTIANNAVTFAKFVTAGSAGFVGATAAGNYSHRTPTQVTAALDAMVGDSGSGGTKGLVPAPASGDASKFLKGDGTWATPSGGGSNERTRVKPSAASFTLENAGTATASDGTSGLILTTPGVSSAAIRFLRYTAGPPATPYSMIVRAEPVSPDADTHVYMCSLILRNSTSGKIIIYSDYQAFQHLVQRWSDYATFSANSLAPTTVYNILRMPWMRVTNDGTTLTFGRSPDGNDWYDFATETLATYIGSVDQIGFGTMRNTTGYTSVASFQSFEIG